MNTSAALYIRVSSEQQAQEGISLEAQEAKLRAYCTLHNLTPCHILIDNGQGAGMSASKKTLAERPEGQKLLELIRSGSIKHVVVFKLDRLFRNTVDCLTNVREWDKRGIALHLVDMGGQSINTASAMGRMFLTMTAGFAELEAGLISERTKTAIHHLQAQGVHCGRRKRSTEDKPAYDRAFELRSNGFSYYEIADKLTQEGFKPAQSQKWAEASVRYMLKKG